MTNKLSICMIVKDEENNLRRCLESIKPLLKDNFAELIIVDTGSTDNTVKIAKEYTNKVYFHQWNNNFSDMRNFSISYACGEWILILDADEELMNPDTLIELLISDFILDYNTIQVSVNNIINKAGNRVIFSIGERIFKNDGEFCYSGSIHNQAQVKQPVYLSEIKIDHYGYINDDDELMEKKFKRTSKMLMDELEKNPNHIYYRFQLARTYFMHKDYYAGYMEIKGAYKKLREFFEDINDIPKDLYYVFIEYARMSFMLKRYEETIDVAKEGLILYDNYIDFYFYLGYAYFNQENELEGEKAFIQYFELYSKYEKNELNYHQYTTVEFYSIDADIKSKVAYKFVNHLIEVKKYKKAEKYIAFIDNEWYKYECLIKIIINNKKYEEFEKIRLQLTQDSQLIFISALEKKLKELDNDTVKVISRTFIKKDNEDSYNLINRTRVGCDKEENRLALFRQILSKTSINQLPINLFSEIFNELLLIDKGYFLKEIKKFNSIYIKKFVLDIIEEYSNEDKIIDLIIEDNKRVYSSVDLHKCKVTICSALLLSHVNDKPDEKYKQIFKKFVSAGKQYVLNVYQPEKLRLIYPLVDNDSFDKLFILIILIEQAKEINLKSAINYYKEVLEAYPYFSAYLNEDLVNIKTQLEINSVINDIQKVNNTNSNLKVFQGTIEIAGQVGTIVKGLNQKSNVTAFGLNYYPGYINYRNTNQVDILKAGNKEVITQSILDETLHAFDIFHFHYNTSIMPDFKDIQILKETNKKIFMHNWGTDVRRVSIAKKLSPYTKLKIDPKNNIGDETSIIKELEFLAYYIDDCIVADAELYEYVKGFYNRVHYVRQALDINEYTSSENFEFRKTKPVIVHAPTSTDFKGTKTVNAVIEKLKLKYDIDYKLVQNLSHSEAKEIYRDADIIIDQLHSVGHGMLALEAMAMGKPVISSISDFMLDFYPKEIPIFRANPENLESKVETLIKDNEMRKVLGKKGREYVEKYHDHREIADVLLKLYNS
ncbi:glycosyltransferase [Lysinibacillus sp. BW-2-10]|uniref:glycosyltransferase n=1 Tax=Lysinibacillus sp. BW-2-10 TaxID=2590030 RepID=UPI00117FC069|nr:glycosyltransferase [Lysinibacillus sp. BW-2-10]TSI07321.1 glycosyltransferase [Lysinibacillus sp. BW-2-10]